MSADALFPLRNLHDAGVRLYDCEHKTPLGVPSGYPYIAIPDIRDGRLDLTNVRRISAEDFAEWTRKTKPQQGDIIMTRRGRVGDTAVVPVGLECAIGQNLVILRSESGQVVQEYLRWALNGPLYEQQVDKYLNVGAVFSSLNCRHIPLFEIPIPTPTEQRRISGVLTALDAKIEHNGLIQRRLIALAKQGVVERIAKVGGVWERANLVDVFEIGLGGTWGSDADDGGLSAARVVRGIDVHHLAEGGFPEIPLRFVRGTQLAKRLLKPGQVLVEASGSFCGRSGLVDPSWLKLTQEPLSYSNFTKCMTPKVEKSVAVVAWVQLLGAYDRGEVAAFRTGSAFPNLDVAGLLNGIEVRLPPLEEAQPLSDLIHSALDARLRVESRRLASIRDALLPKLVSGEIRVPDSYDPDDVLGTVAETAGMTA